MKTVTTQTLANRKINEDLSVLKTTTKKVKAEVQFGSPQKSCTGVGICRVGVLSATNTKTESHSNKKAIAYLSLTREKALKVSFFKESLSEIAKKIYFHNLKFVVQDDVEFPQPIAERLEVPKIRLVTGVYKVEESEQFLTVIFNKLK